MGLTKGQEQGVTLLEVLLVIAIALSIIVLSLRQYYGFRVQTDMLRVRTNVDILLQAAAGYYQANCPKGNLLDPTIATGMVKPLNITTDLINSGYLSPTFPQPIPLVDSTGPGGGYIVQFNQYTMPRTQLVCSDPPTCTPALATPAQIGTIVIWKIQVAVLMRNISATQLANAKNIIGADCLSNATGTPPMSSLCSAHQTGNYLVFERLPSYVTSNPDSQSDLWLTTPITKQFVQMYTTNPITDLTNQSHTPEYQYYYCSG